MYIEFELARPDDITPGLVSYRANNIIDQALEAWSEKYQTPYKTKREKYKKRVTFDSDESYSLFAMTWNVDQKFHALSRWRIVSDLNNKIEFDSVL
jgi:hypothetical protein